MKLKNLSFVLLFSLFLSTNLFAQGKLTVTIFDMKVHGLAMVMQTPTGKTWLIDTGGGDKEGSFAARDVIVPFLEKAGVKSLDGIIISHPHGDHRGGLPYILEKYQVKELVDPGFNEIGGGENLFYRKLREDYVAKGGKSVIVKLGTKLDIDPKLDVQVLWPPEGLYRPEGKKDEDLYNINSMVVRVQYGKIVFMFPGDNHGIGSSSRKFYDPALLKCDLLVAPHHGLNSNKAQADATQPKYVVMSSKDDRSIHPYDLAKKIFVGAQVYATWIDGTVTAVTNGKKLKVTTAGKPGQEGK